MTSPLESARRIVVKIGSSLLVDSESGTLRRAWLESLCADIAALKRQGKEIILVSSGAIALGCCRSMRESQPASGPLTNP